MPGLRRSLEEDRFTAIVRKSDDVERELRRLGLWQEGPPPAIDATQAYGGLTLPGWLQFTVLPRVRATAAERGAFPAPPQSERRHSISFHFVREYQMWSPRDDSDRLIGLLEELEDLMFRT
jgi:uncharacterized protein YqcC (DUF446 family)